MSNQFEHHEPSKPFYEAQEGSKLMSLFNEAFGRDSLNSRSVNNPVNARMADVPGLQIDGVQPQDRRSASVMGEPAEQPSRLTLGKDAKFHEFEQKPGLALDDTSDIVKTVNKYFDEINKMPRSDFHVSSTDGFISGDQVRKFLHTDKGQHLSFDEKRCLESAAFNETMISAASNDEWGAESKGITRMDLVAFQANEQEAQRTFDGYNYLRSNWDSIAQPGHGVDADSWNRFCDKRMMAHASKDEIRMMNEVSDFLNQHSTFKIVDFHKELSRGGLQDALKKDAEAWARSYSS